MSRVRCCAECQWLAQCKDRSLVCLAVTTTQTIQTETGETQDGLLVAIFAPSKPTDCGEFQYRVGKFKLKNKVK